jgi:hypothetical protein
MLYNPIESICPVWANLLAQRQSSGYLGLNEWAVDKLLMGTKRPFAMMKIYSKIRCW